MAINNSPTLHVAVPLLPFLFILLCSHAAIAQRNERLIDTWKPVHYSVEITLNGDLTEITHATTEITLSVTKPRVTTIDLDFGNLPVDRVLLNHRRTRFRRDADSIIVALPKPMPIGSRQVITVSYHGKPSNGLVMAKDKDGEPSVVGDNWPDRVHHWIPTLDHPSAKASVTFSITAPADQVVVANGELVHSSGGINRTWVFKESEPIPPYCMVFAAGQFAELRASQPAVTPLTYYVPRSDAEFAQKGFAAAAPSLQLFSQTVAPYPYEKLALIVGATQFGGMENSSAIVFASNLFTPRANAELSPSFGVRKGIVEVVAHEIAHQWFGDSVTESTWADLWLSEGFATYFAGIFVQKTDGEAAFRSYMKDAAAEALKFERQQRLPLHDKQTTDLMKLLNGNNYQKGAWVLHMLRGELGDDAFFRGIRNYYNEHEGGVASSEDLSKALESASNRRLDDFFASWVYGTGHPVYELTWSWNDVQKVLRLRIKQTQTEPAFPNALPVLISTASGTERTVVRPTSKDFVQEVSLHSAPTSVSVDPDETVLKELSMRRAASSSSR